MLTRTLEAAGYGVTVAADGGGALVEIERSAPDLIVLDVTMPGLDGLARDAAAARRRATRSRCCC